MADAIVRLKVESQEYDQKLQRATQQLQHMEKEVRRTGASFAYADKEELAFIQSLGQMETKATSAKQKMREYSEAITSMTATYRALSNEEKNSEWGKALSASIDQLKAKASELQDIMSDTQREIQNLASDTSFTDGIGLMTRTVGSCAAAITAWTGDSKEMDAVIKDLAKIGATVAAIDALTKAFQKQNLVLLKNPYVVATAAVVALGVAIGKLIQKSQELDGVQKTLQEVQNKGRENAAKEITRIEALNNILHDNTRSMEERKSALAEIQALVPNYHGALTTEGNLINDNTDAMNDYIDSLQRAAIAQAAFDRMVELQKQKMQQQLDLQKRQKELQSAQARNTSAQGQVVYAGTEMTQVYTQQGVTVAERSVQQAEADIRATNAEIDALRSLINANDLGTGSKVTRTTKVGSGASAVTPTAATDAATMTYADDSIKAQEAKVAELTELWKEASAELRDGYYAQLQKAKSELEEMKKPLTELKGQMSFAVEPVKIKIDTSNLKLAKNDAQGMRNAFSAAASAVATVGGALQQIEDPAAKVAGIVAAAVAQVALTFASSLKGTVTPWDWIAAALAGTATMISTITAIKSVTSAKGYAGGGMVEGTSYSGDNIVARLNAGEGVLTAKGVENAETLEGIAEGRGGDVQSTPYTKGEYIFLGVNNYLGRSGRGELVTTKMLKRAGISL